MTIDRFDPDDTEHVHALGIDPGSVTLGLAILKLHWKTYEITDALAWTANATRLPTYLRYDASLYNDRFARIQAHKRNLRHVLDIYNPAYIACESPFYNPRRPNAYGLLVEVTSAIVDVVYEWNPQVAVHFVDPPTVKKDFGAKGAGKGEAKTVMFDAYKRNTHLHFPGTQDLDEHAIDGLAVAVSHYRKYKPNPGDS